MPRRVLTAVILLPFYFSTLALAEFQYPEQDRALVTKLRSEKPRHYRFVDASMESVFVLLARDAKLDFREMGKLPGILVTVNSHASPFSAMETLAEKYGFRLNHVDGKWQVDLDRAEKR